MNTRLTLPLQWTLALVIGLMLSYTFRPLTATAPVTVAAPTQTALSTAFPTFVNTPSPAPFVTLPGGWLVRITFGRQASPQIVKVIYLNEARLTAYPLGNNRIQILDPAGQVLYEQSFQVEFLEGDPPLPVEQKKMIFVLPAINRAVRILVQTPNGEAFYDLR